MVHSSVSGTKRFVSTRTQSAPLVKFSFDSDTEKINVECFDKILSRYGAKFTNEIRFKIMGRIDRDVYPIFIEEYKLEVSEEDLAAEIQEELSKRMPDVALMPGNYRHAIFSQV